MFGNFWSKAIRSLEYFWSKEIQNLEYEEIQNLEYEEIQSLEYKEIQSLEFKEMQSLQYEEIRTLTLNTFLTQWANFLNNSNILHVILKTEINSKHEHVMQLFRPSLSHLLEQSACQAGPWRTMQTLAARVPPQNVPVFKQLKLSAPCRSK